MLLPSLLLWAVLPQAGAGSGASSDPQGESKPGEKEAIPAAAPTAEAMAHLVESLAQAGVRVDIEQQRVSIPATVLIRNDYLEYLLVTELGQAHESLLLTDVRPSILNTALIAIGLEPGRNASVGNVASDSSGAEGEENRPDLDSATAAHATDVRPPEGDGVYLYVAWREGEEVYFYRVDDLIANVNTGRSLARHAWVYLGSRFVRPRARNGEPPPEPQFAADLEGNLINICYFLQGNTLITAARPECIEQEIWVGNAWLLPPQESPVEFLIAREPLSGVPEDWLETLPSVQRDATDEAVGAGR